jgi:hypothetical protein
MVYIVSFITLTFREIRRLSRSEEIVPDIGAFFQFLVECPAFQRDRCTEQLKGITAGRVPFQGEDPDPLEIEKVIMKLVQGERTNPGKCLGCCRSFGFSGEEPYDPFFVVS